MLHFLAPTPRRTTPLPPKNDDSNTYGGCNLAVAAGRAVLSEIRRLGLQRRAAAVGARLLAALEALRARHPDVIGDVRGRGLLLGVEIVRGAAGAKLPAPATADWLKQSARERGVLISTDGPYENVVKIKPPLVFSERDADALAGTLGALLKQLSGDAALRGALEADEARRAAAVAPVAAAYAENAARIYALARGGIGGGLGGVADCGGAAAAAATLAAAAAAAAAPAAAAGSDCSMGSCGAGASPTAAAAAPAAAVTGGKGGSRGGTPSLLRRVMSWASARSERSADSSFEPFGR